MPAVLFVCTANQCRSPLAAAFFQQQLQQAGLKDWQVESAGTWAQPNKPAPGPLVQAAQAVGIDLRHHRSRPIDQLILLHCFDLILTMEHGQREALCVEYPTLRNRIHLLSAMAGPPYNVSDPIGGGQSQYDQSVREITRLLQVGFTKILTLIPHQHSV